MGKVTHQTPLILSTHRVTTCSPVPMSCVRTGTFSYDGMNRLASDGRTTIKYSPSGNIDTQIRRRGLYLWIANQPACPHRHRKSGQIPHPHWLAGNNLQFLQPSQDSIYDWMSAAKFTYNGELRPCEIGLLPKRENPLHDPYFGWML